MKFCGIIGFYTEAEEIEHSGIWQSGIIEKTYKGDILKSQIDYDQQDGPNNNMNIKNRISILADLYATSHTQNIRYVIMNGAKWSVTGISVDPPRIALTLGGIYNDEPETT